MQMETSSGQRHTQLTATSDVMNGMKYTVRKSPARRRTRVSASAIASASTSPLGTPRRTYLSVLLGIR